MPGKLQVLHIVAIVLQYSLLILLYYFLYRVLAVAVRDLRSAAADETNFPVGDKQYQDIEGSANPRLVVVEDCQELLAQTVIPLAGSLMIGRSRHNNLVIDSSFVSHEHACISKMKHHYLLADLNSTNGTLLNGQQVDGEMALADGDMIQIGAVTLKFER